MIGLPILQNVDNESESDDDMDLWHNEDDMNDKNKWMYICCIY